MNEKTNVLGSISAIMYSEFLHDTKSDQINIRGCVSAIMDTEFRYWKCAGTREMISECHIEIDNLDVFGERKFSILDSSISEVYEDAICPASHNVETISVLSDRIKAIVYSPLGDSWDYVIVTNVTIIPRMRNESAYEREEI